MSAVEVESSKDECAVEQPIRENASEMPIGDIVHAKRGSSEDICKIEVIAAAGSLSVVVPKRPGSPPVGSNCVTFKYGVRQCQIGLVSGAKVENLRSFLEEKLLLPAGKILAVMDSYSAILPLEWIVSSPHLLREPCYDIYLGVLNVPP